MSPPVWVFFGNENALALLPVDERLPHPAALVPAPGRDLAAFAAQAQRFPAARILLWPSRPALLPAFARRLRRLRPRLFVSCGFNRRLPPVLFRLPLRGTVNIHGGWLPSMRGAHVLQWALIEDHASIGVTLHRMDGGLDTGPWIARARLPIRETDDALRLRTLVYRRGYRLLAAHFSRLLAACADEHPQREADARYYPRRRPEDGRLDWTRTARELHQLVRALVSPWPGAWTDTPDGRLIIRRSLVCPDHGDLAPGTPFRLNDEIWRIACGRGALAILQAEDERGVLDSQELTRRMERGNLGNAGSRVQQPVD